MKRVLIGGRLKSLISTRWRSSVERTLRHQVSEHVLLQVHEELFLPIRSDLHLVRGAVENASCEAIAPGVQPARRTMLAAIDELRRLLDGGAKERELQTALVKSGLLQAYSGRVLQEVAIEASSTESAMRLDLLLESDGNCPSEIIELKRGSHLLLAYSGKPAERLSQGFIRALNQLVAYGGRVDSDIEAAISIRDHHGIEVDRPNLRLVAGRRLPNAESYQLLSFGGSDSDGSRLLVYTWDGLVTELERIVG